MSNKSLMKSLPIVAAALGKKHGINVVIRPDLTTAGTDGKTIYLPVLPDTDEALVLARGFIDHESAHIRYTDFKVGMGKGLRKSLINILEDIRIEQLLGRELPGCRINLEALEKAFVDGDVYGALTEQSHPQQILASRIHHGLRVRVLQNLCTTGLADNAMRLFAKAFPAHMVQKIDMLLDEADQLRDTQHASDLADRILAVVAEDTPPQDSPDEGDEGEQGDPNQEQPQSSDTEEEDQDSGKGEDGESEDDGDTSDQGGTQPDDSTNSGDDESDNDPAGGQGESEDDDDQGDDTEGKGGNADDEPDDDQGEADSSDGDQEGDSEGEGSDTDPQHDADQGEAEAKEQNRKALLESADDEIVDSSDLGDKLAKILSDLNYEARMHGTNSGTFPKVVPAKSGVGIEPSEASRETNALRTRLNGLIQASKLKRSPPRRVGNRIDTRSLHKLSSLDTRVFRGSEVKVAVNTGVVLLIDQSVSMGDQKRDATKAAMAVALALDVIPGVKLSIAGFTSQKEVPGQGRYVPIVRPMKMFNQRLDKKCFVPMADGGTPTAEALWWAASELLAQKVDRRIVITVTDGAPDDAQRVIELVQRMKQASIENNAIGIGMEISAAMFPSNCTVNSISELPEKVFGMLQNMLVVH